jgi:hypothetical protein
MLTSCRPVAGIISVSNGGNNVRGGSSDDRSDGCSMGGGNNVRGGTPVLVGFQLWDPRQTVIPLLQWP